MTFGKKDFSEETGSEGCQVGGAVLKASVILRSKELEAVSIGSFEEQNKTKQPRGILRSWPCGTVSCQLSDFT
jgi:hypothetical protein